MRNRASSGFCLLTLLLFGENYLLGENIYPRLAWGRKEISASCYVLLHHNLMATWDVLIDTRYFTLAAPWGIATHSDEYRLPSLITRYVRINRLSTILPPRIAGNTASEAYGSAAGAARVVRYRARPSHFIIAAWRARVPRTES